MKTGKSEFGKIETLNIDGHELIRKQLIDIIKEAPDCKIEILMNLPGGALFFLPTFRGKHINIYIF